MSSGLWFAESGAERDQPPVPGSYLVVAQPPSDMQRDAPGLKEGAAAVSTLMAEKITPRSREQVTRFFDGLELLEPGVVPIQKWRPDNEPPAVLLFGYADR